MPTLETERLILRTWRVEDLKPFAAMLANPEVTRFVVLGGEPLSRFQAWQALCAIVGHWHLRGFGQIPNPRSTPSREKRRRTWSVWPANSFRTGLSGYLPVYGPGCALASCWRCSGAI